MAGSRQQVVKFSCPHCHATLRIAAAQSGSQGKCPTCHQLVEAPSASAIQHGIAVGRKVRKEQKWERNQKLREYQVVTFECGSCHTRISVASDNIGGAVKCPDCHVINAVPIQKAKQVRSPPLSADPDRGYYRLHEGVDQPPVMAATDIHVICKLCGTRLYAKPSQIGSRIACPDCQTANLVVKPEKKRRAVNSPDASEAYEMKPPDLTSRNPTAGKDVLAGARARVADQERRKPLSPKRPFVSGIFPYLLSMRVIVIQLSLGAGGLAVVSLINASIALMVGYGAIMGVYLLAFTSIVVVGYVVFLCISFLTIVETTFTLRDQIDDWPSFDPTAWLLRSFFVVNSFAMGFVPGVVIGRILDHDGAYDWIGLASSFVLFPVLLLSMLESASQFNPYSKVVLWSLRGSWHAWVKFYLVVTLLAALVVGAFLSGQFIGDAWRNIVTIGLASVIVIVYARLLGRLAWVISTSLPNAKTARGNGESK